MNRFNQPGPVGISRTIGMQEKRPAPAGMPAASAVLLVALIVVAPLVAEETAGKRPYELTWAGRTSDTRPPSIDFENLDGWTVDLEDAAADFERSQEQLLWGQSVGKLRYRSAGSRPVVRLKPPQATALPKVFDSVNLWVYGNNWAWSLDRSTPRVTIAVILRGGDGQTVRLALGQVRWKEWWLMHRRLSAEEREKLGEGGVFEAIEISGGRNKEDRLLYFDNLCFYEEPLPALKFAPRPERNLTLFEGQTCGANTGPGRLPFPTREETILPKNIEKEFATSLEEDGDGYVFHYRGNDGHLVYRYHPSGGTLGDVTACWEGRGETFQPLAEGGIALAVDAGEEAAPPERIEPIGCDRRGDTVVSRWRCVLGDRTAEVSYTLRLWQKSLVIDVAARGGLVGEFRVGYARGVGNPRLVTLPYLTCGKERPAVLVSGPVELPLFTMALVDYYRSNASELWAINRIDEQGAWHNGGSRYRPKTDGQRNDCFERLFLTVSPRFEEVLPNVANPKSPWMHVAGERLWRAHGASKRELDYARWKEVARYGMTQVVITDHETGWRDGGESFTFRTRAAPGKGGDQGQADYARNIRSLGFRYGIYNNYTDYAPVNEHWDEDCVTRLPNGEWRTSWARCYNPKPARAVEFESRLAPVIQQKFQLDTAYCDVHTAVQPWRYCDYDARVPGAGTFAATFYAYGEIMLHQKATWNGPVYSEGNNHWYYCGLTDGNYGQDQVARLKERPWLVDFDLRKLHPLCCNFGMGNLGMFYGRREGLGDSPEERCRRLDRFLAATLAFGHTGFLVLEGGMENAVRSYFNLQQVHAHYAQETAVEIQYADAERRLLDTSAAVASGAFERSQVRTRYSNGLVVAVNGHPSETWTTPEAVLPPNGWHACGDLADGKLVAFSALRDGHRVDYVDSPAYVYADGRGRLTRFEKACCDGQLIAHKRPQGKVELIPVGRVAAMGVDLAGQAATAVALDKEGEPLGPAETRFSRGLVHVLPVENAFSYLLSPEEPPAVVLQAERTEVIPGETLVVRGNTDHTLRIPEDARPGEQLWQSFEGAWIDFTVRPLADAVLELGDGLRLTLVPNVAGPTEATVALDGREQRVRFEPGKPVTVEFPWSEPSAEKVQTVNLALAAGELRHRQTWWIKSESSVVALGDLPREMETGQCLRGEAEKPFDDVTRAYSIWSQRTCGEKTRDSLFMHPPYVQGVGYTYALFPPLDLPEKPRAAFRCYVGKADGSDPGDGILFRVVVVDEAGSETGVASQSWIRHAWTPLCADLGRWAGQRVRLKLIADVGPGDNPSGDWACWSDLHIESARPTLVTTIHEKPVALQRQPGPFPVSGLHVDRLRVAKAGKLHFQAIGLQAGAPYVSEGFVNGISLGQLPAGGGNEKHGTWGDVAVPLPPAAIASLDEWNTFSIRNPGGDCFKIGRVWIELELDDGRKASSQKTMSVFTQPPGWLYAEGTGVEQGEDITVTVRFPSDK